MKMTLTEFKEFLDYDSNTGVFTWRPRHVPAGFSGNIVKCWNGRHAGKKARKRDRYGYYRISIKGGPFYAAHRLAWLFFYGKEPVGHIDHINGVITDNRIANLRIATQSQNMANCKRRKDNTSGCKGVSLNKNGRWHARIMMNWRMHNLGTFDSKEDAIKARKNAEKTFHGEFSNQG